MSLIDKELYKSLVMIKNPFSLYGVSHMLVNTSRVK